MWGLALLAFAVHAYGIMADFVYDDAVMFQQPSASLDWSRIPRSFTTNQSLFFGSNFYRPILNVLYEVTRALFGPRAPAWHVISILLHIACVLLVFRLALKLIDNTLIAGTAAALFAVHPAHVEVISWASAMADMLMTALMLLTVLLFLRWMEQGKMLWWIASFAAGAACIFTKETAVVLPVVLLVTAFALRSRPAPAAGTASVAEPAPAAGAASVAAFPSAAMPDLPVLAATIPFFAITLIYLGLRQHVLGAFSHPLNPSSNAQMIFTWPSALLFYLRHMFWPSAVVPYYPVSIVTGWRGFLLPLITLIAVAAVLGYLLWRSAGWQRFCICLVWILSPLAPALYLKAQAPFDLVHDRFLYAPLVGFCIAAALVLQLATQRIESRTQWRGYPLIAAVLVLLLSIESLSQMVWWQNNLTLFTRAVSVTPNNPRALTGLAEAYLNAGHFDEAVPLLQRALAIDPRHSPALFCMGRIAWMRGDDADAEKYLIQALSIQPRYDIWLHLASVEMHRKQVDAAEDAVRQALAMNPTGIGAHAALGTILLSKGDRPGAAREFRQELRIYPQSDVARMGLERASGNPPH
jgi:tetratricopeptide (TPR) repeat protein